MFYIIGGMVILGIKKLAAFLAVSCFMILLTVKVFAGGTGVVTDSAVNVREEASTNSKILGKMNKNQSVTLLETDGDWFKIQYSNGSAFINADYIQVLTVDGLINDDRVNFRKEASTSSGIIEVLKVGTSVVVNYLSGDFYSVTYNGKSGFVHKNYILGTLLSCAAKKTTQQPAAAASPVIPAAAAVSAPAAEESSYFAIVISPGGVNLRKAPDLEASVLCAIPLGDTADVLGMEGDEWVKLSYGSYTGYSRAEFLTVQKGENPNSGFGTRVVEFAKQFLGTPYRWAGTDLRKGVDCSGFTYAVYKNFGISLNRTSRDQIDNGARVQKNELKAGDLVFFDTNGYGGISHVGIYIGGGNFIHSSSSYSSYCVTINNLSEKYYVARYMGACRVK